MEQLSFTVKEAAEQLRISERKMQELIANSEVRSYRTGRRRLVSADALRDYIARQEAAEQPVIIAGRRWTRVVH